MHELLGFAAVLIFVAENQFPAHACADAFDFGVVAMARGAAVGMPLRDPSDQPPVFRNRKRVCFQGTQFIPRILDGFVDIERAGFFDEDFRQFLWLGSFLRWCWLRHGYSEIADEFPEGAAFGFRKGALQGFARGVPAGRENLSSFLARVNSLRDIKP